MNKPSTVSIDRMDFTVLILFALSGWAIAFFLIGLHIGANR
jgi:hypothetical protein